MKVVFVDWKPINNKSDIYSGGSIRRHYAWITLNKMYEEVVPFRNENGRINLKALYCLFKNDSKIWVEYGCGRIAHILVLLASVVKSRVIVLNVHDAILQQRDFYKEISLIKRIQVKFIEQMLINRANTLIFAWPELLHILKPNHKCKTIIMPPGVGEDELFVPSLVKINNAKKIALYFGSMQRKGAISGVVDLFSELDEWELHLIGLKEGEDIVERNNIKYLGPMSHDKLPDALDIADVILIPLPNNDYSDKVMPIKLGYVLKSCKPVITTKTTGISEYVSMTELEDNVIYVDEWDLKNLKDALSEAERASIDSRKTIEKLKPMAWEPRFFRLIEVAFNNQDKCDDILQI